MLGVLGVSQHSAPLAELKEPFDSRGWGAAVWNGGMAVSPAAEFGAVNFGPRAELFQSAFVVFAELLQKHGTICNRCGL
jgi:hypothetical protein